MDEAADALMTRLGFLLGDKIIPGEPGSSYHAQDDGEVISSAQNAFIVKLHSLSVTYTSLFEKNWSYLEKYHSNSIHHSLCSFIFY